MRYCTGVNGILLFGTIFSAEIALDPEIASLTYNERTEAPLADRSAESQPYSQPIALRAAYSSLDPTSVAQHFAFYELYPNTSEGKEALRHAWRLLSGGEEQDPRMLFPEMDVTPLISLVNRSPLQAMDMLTEEQIEIVEKLGRHLGNRKLAGHGLKDEKLLDAMPSEQIDIARSLFLMDMKGNLHAVRTYEASIDLMALQILARLPDTATPQDKIRAINHYIFSEMRFRFPPQSLVAQGVDLYTFLPSVIDSRRGVCLGVSVLYLALAQRLDLPLEIITPPGHIYVRYRAPDGTITNIETTARGIDLPTEIYIGLETRQLEQRTVKETMALVFMNQAADAWHKKENETAIALYKQAERFLPNDYLLKMFLGFNYLFAGREKEGKALLQEIRNQLPDSRLTKDTAIDDYLSGKADVDALRTVFLEVDESRASILEKQQELQKVVTRWPKFRQGLFHLAVTYLQLGREKEAVPILERYVALDASDPVVQYYLSAIHLQRSHYNQSWRYLRRAEEIASSKGCQPRALQELRRELRQACPEPKS